MIIARGSRKRSHLALPRLARSISIASTPSACTFVSSSRASTGLQLPLATLFDGVDDVRSAGRLEGCICGVRRGVNDDELGAAFTCSLQDGGEPRGVCAGDDGGICLAQIGPLRSRRLGVKVHDDGGVSGALARDREAARDRGLPGPSLLGEQCNGIHVRILT